MQGYKTLGSWRGAPIHAHWTVLLGLPWFYMQRQDLYFAGIAFLGFTFLMLIHEIGHAIVSRWRKVRVHHIRLHFLHGLCNHDQPPRKVDDIWIAWGGVLAQLALFVLALILTPLILHASVRAYILLSPLLWIFTWGNAFVMAINLLPFPSLDGHTAWQVWPIWRDWCRSQGLGGGAKPPAPAKRPSHLRLVEKSERATEEIIERMKRKP